MGLHYACLLVHACCDHACFFACMFAVYVHVCIPELHARDVLLTICCMAAFCVEDSRGKVDLEAWL